MIGSSDNSGGVVVGALVCGTECSGFKSHFMLRFFFFTHRNSSSHRIPVHNEIHSLTVACPFLEFVLPILNFIF